MKNEKGFIETALFIAGAIIFGVVIGSGALGKGTSATGTGPGQESQIVDSIN